MADTAIGSVGDTTAASAKATAIGIAGIIQWMNRPMPMTVIRTRPSASSTTVEASFSNSSLGIRQPSRNSSGGRKSSRNSSGSRDRKSTRLELQSLMRISYAVFCLKKKKTTIIKQENHQTNKVTKNVT